MTDEALRRIDALIQVAMRIARSAPSGKVTLARIADVVDPRWLRGELGARIAAELEAARAAACVPIDPERVERALRDAWGTAASDELDDLDLEPVAVTPGAQVHKASLDGAPVAVKVLRPGLAASVRQDLTLLEGLLAPLSAAFPALDPRAIVSEARERVLDELDLEHEAHVQRRFHRALREHPFLRVPAPLTRLSHEGVLVSEWVDGVSIARAPDPDQAAARLVTFALGAARTGMIHADIDPRDVLVQPDGRLAILDFGAVGEVDGARVSVATRMVDAFAEGDAEALGAALEQLRVLPARLGPTALELTRHALGELGGTAPSRLDSGAVIAVGRRLLERQDELAELIQAGALAPADLWPVRSLGQMFSTIARAGATGPWLDLTRSALHHGWSRDPSKKSSSI
jgi:predicted unusual protein kinase regulating ubiquinone biosynthesis (AarF/ABC1/UbiB family)